MDFVSKIVKEPHNWGLLQRHGWAEARPYDGRPRQSNTLPIMQIGQAHAAVIPQKTVQGTLEKYRYSIKINLQI